MSASDRPFVGSAGAVPSAAGGSRSSMEGLTENHESAEVSHHAR
ncbi:hypothetical protein [Natronomonas marina]|nr:hypothetical protein [Natronomonas marina]